MPNELRFQDPYGTTHIHILTTKSLFNFVRKCPLYAGLKIYNTHPDKLKNNNNYKEAIKTYIFDRSFYFIQEYFDNPLP